MKSRNTAPLFRPAIIVPGGVVITGAGVVAFLCLRGLLHAADGTEGGTDEINPVPSAQLEAEAGAEASAPIRPLPDVAERPRSDRPQAPSDPVRQAEANDAIESARLYRVRLDERFVAEATDDSWSRPAAAHFADDWSRKLPPGSRLVSAECRSSMCRGEVMLPDIPSYDKFARGAIAASDASIGSVIVMREADRERPELHGFVFVARGAVDLPSADALSAAR